MENSSTQVKKTRYTPGVLATVLIINGIFAITGFQAIKRDSTAIVLTMLIFQVIFFVYYIGYMKNLKNQP